MAEQQSIVLNRHILLLLFTIFLAAGIFLIDLLLPLGVAAGVPYVGVVLLSSWLPWRRCIVLFAAISTILIAAGFIFSPPAGVLWMVVANRLVAVFAAWVTAVLLVQRQRAERALKSAHDGLETEVAERTEALREREARLQGIMDNVEDGIITINEKGVIESFNRSAEVMFGHAAEQVRGKNVNVLMPEPYQSKHDDYLENYRNTGESKLLGLGAREFSGLRKDGSTFPIELSVSKMNTGLQPRFIGVARDISQRKDAEAQLLQAQKMEAIGHLTGGIAHDFNNLLTAILGNLDLMKDRLTDHPEIQKFLDIAMRATLRGSELTQRLLAFSRKQPLNPKPTKIEALATGMTDLIRRTLGEDIEVETVMAGGLWQALVDPGQLESAILNLAINSRDAMPEGGKLTIETANTRLDQAYADNNTEVNAGQYVQLAITDNGFGMPQDVVARAFEPFFTTKEAGKGTGLGLSMVYGFVKQSNGHIKIYSEEGIGTTIKLYLPRAIEAGSGVRDSGSMDRKLPLGEETILVVEDDPDVRDFVVAALAMLGYRVLEAEDGPAALSLLDGAPQIDMLLTDVVLPRGMNGREVAEAVTERYPAIKVLYTSGYTDNAIVHHGRLDANAELLSKPYVRETLAKRVRQILDAEKDQRP